MRAEMMARKQAAARRRRLGVLAAVIAAGALVIAAVVGIVVYQTREKPDERAAIPAAVSPDGVGLVMGSGPVQVELYSDFLCPACRAFEKESGDELEKLVADKRIKLVYRPVAILDGQSTNEYSTRSAAGAGCASDAGRLFEYARILFDNQPAEGGAGHTDGQLVRLAASAGVNGSTFTECVTDGRYKNWVERVTEAMARNNVPGTPTVLVAGSRLEQPTGARLTEAVDRATGGTERPSPA